MRIISRFRSAALSLAVLGLCLSLSLAGCGTSNKGGPVTGMVTYKGTPLTTGSVRLHPKTGEPMMGTIDGNGNYMVGEVPPGEYTVSVEVNTASTVMVPKGGAPMPGIPDPPKPVGIPAKFADPKTSGQTLEVKGNKGAKKDIPLAD